MLTIIGHTGFVGSILNTQRPADIGYNSKNFKDMHNTQHDLVICAGVNAIKWQANKNPVADIAAIEDLWLLLKTIKAKTMVLISTVDVYPSPFDVDETTCLDGIDNHPYGKHRLQFEKMIQGHFEHAKIIRLPALFGNGLRKNIIFDMMNQRLLESINPESSFQWYGLDRLWSDIDKVLALDIPLINLVVQPVTTNIIQQRFFPGLNIGSSCSGMVKYDIRTVNDQSFDSNKGYIENQEDVLKRMGEWLQRETKV